MSDLSTMIPLIVGGVSALGGLVTLLWMKTHRPELRVPVRPEEGAQSPFEGPLERYDTFNTAARTLADSIAQSLVKVSRATKRRGSSDLSTETNAFGPPRIIEAADKS